MKETSINILIAACNKFDVGNDLNVMNQVLENMVTTGYFYLSGIGFSALG